jgi:Flp pilus assembly CpaE family ATPase
MAKVGRSLHILATEEGFDDTVRMSDDKVLMLADTMRANFAMSVLDLPRHFVTREPQLFTRCDDIVIVSELTLQSLRDANRMSRILQMRNRKAKIHVVANQVIAKPDITVKEFEAGIEGRLRCVFPLEGKAMGKAALKGQPLVAAEPNHKIAADLHKFCIELAGVPEETKRQGLFGLRSKRK